MPEQELTPWLVPLYSSSNQFAFRWLQSTVLQNREVNCRAGVTPSSCHQNETENAYAPYVEGGNLVASGPSSFDERVDMHFVEGGTWLDMHFVEGGTLVVAGSCQRAGGSPLRS